MARPYTGQLSLVDLLYGFAQTRARIVDGIESIHCSALGSRRKSRRRARQL